MKILLVGDVMLGRLVNQILREKPPIYPWGDTLPIFKKADFRLCNLECVISNLGEPWSQTAKIFHFRSDAKNIAVLAKAGINAVSLANNHTLDYGHQAMFEMFKILDNVGIIYAGAGGNFQEASRPKIVVVGDLKVGLIAFTDNEPQWQATKKVPGIFYVPIDLKDRRAKNFLEIVKKTKNNIDLLVVSAHWGPNWGYRPPGKHITFAHALIDTGVDIVFGHSAHVFRGIETYKSRPIIYSTGDFIDDYAVDESQRNDQSFIFVVETQGEEIANIYLYPTIIHDFQARLAQGKEAGEVAAKMIKLCQELKTVAVWQRNKKYLTVKIN